MSNVCSAYVTRLTLPVPEYIKVARVLLNNFIVFRCRQGARLRHSNDVEVTVEPARNRKSKGRDSISRDSGDDFEDSEAASLLDSGSACSRRRKNKRFAYNKRSQNFSLRVKQRCCSNPSRLVWFGFSCPRAPHLFSMCLGFLSCVFWFGGSLARPSVRPSVCLSVGASVGLLSESLREVCDDCSYVNEYMSDVLVVSHPQVRSWLLHFRQVPRI